jgi:MoaA/NifB/PqqE/SkfB family radical SAM enzyme
MKLKKKLNFDICTFCNHKCTFCSNPDSRTIKSQVTYEQYIKVMDNVTNHIDANEMGLSAKGEVLINSDLAKIVKTTKEKYKIPYIYISSNGALATKEKMEELIKAGLDSTKFSINAIDKESYNSVHLSDDFDIVIQNLKDLINLKKEKYPNHKIFISSVTSIDEDKLKQGFKDILGNESYSYINNIIAYKISYTSKFNQTTNEKLITKGCKIPFNEIYINSDSTLGLCCKDYFDEISFGSLLEKDFLELYQSTEYEDIRQMHINKEFTNNHLCKNCLLYEGC